MQLFKKHPRSGAFYPVGQPASKVEPPKPENRTTVTFIAYCSMSDPEPYKLDLLSIDISHCSRIVTTSFSTSLNDMVGNIEQIGFSSEESCLIVCASVRDEYLDLYPAIGFTRNVNMVDKLMQISLTNMPTDRSFGTLKQQLQMQYVLHSERPTKEAIVQSKIDNLKTELEHQNFMNHYGI